MLLSILPNLHGLEAHSCSDQDGVILQVAHCNPYEPFSIALIDRWGKTRLHTLVKANGQGIIATKLSWAGLTEEHRLVITSKHQRHHSAEIAPSLA